MNFIFQRIHLLLCLATAGSFITIHASQRDPRYLEDDFTLLCDYRDGRKFDAHTRTGLKKISKRYNERWSDKSQIKKEHQIRLAEKRKAQDSNFADTDPYKRGQATIAAPIFDVYHRLAHAQRRAAACIQQIPGAHFVRNIELFRRLHTTLVYTNRSTNAELDAIKPTIQHAIDNFVEHAPAEETLYIKVGGNLQIYGDHRGAGKIFFGVPAELSATADTLRAGVIHNMPYGYNRCSEHLHVSLGCVLVATAREAELLARRIHEANIVAEPYVIPLKKLVLMPSLGRAEKDFHIHFPGMAAPTIVPQINHERERELWDGYVMPAEPSAAKRTKSDPSLSEVAAQDDQDAADMQLVWDDIIE
jgi:hypothetical protein